MLRKTFLIPLTFLLIGMISCKGEKQKASSPGELAKEVHSALAKEKDEAMKRLLLADKDSLKKSVKSMSRIVPENSSPIRIDSSDSELTIFYRIQGAYYALQGKPVEEKQKGFRLKKAQRFDLSDSCDVYRNKRYTPSDKLRFNELKIETMKSDKAFRSVTLHATNQLEHDLDDLKVRIKLFKKGDNGEPQMVYRRPVVPDKKFPKGATTAFELPELNGYEPGGKIDRSEISFETKILDAGPKPEYKYCEMVDRLKKGAE